MQKNGNGGRQAKNANVLLVDGSLGLRELNDEHGIELPRGAGYETVGGFVLFRLGSIPKGGETFVFDGRRYTVMQMEGRRVAKVRIERLRSLPPQPSVRMQEGH